MHLLQSSHRPIPSTWAKINMKVSACFIIILFRLLCFYAMQTVFSCVCFSTDEDLIKYGWPEDIW